MKIACVAKGHHPAISGGVESFERNLLEIFKGEEIKIFSYKAKYEKIFKVSNVIEIDNSKNLFEKILLLLLGKKRLLKLRIMKWKPDVIILNTPNDLKFLKNIKAKKILVQHGSYEYYLKSTFVNPKILKLIRNYLNKYIFLSELDKNKFNEYLQLAEERISTIRHASTLTIKQETKKISNKIIVLSRLEKNKKIDLIVRAMKKLENIELEIYGGGEEETKLRKIIEDLELKNVKLFGITREPIKALDRCDIFIMASDFEGYPISCIEAMRRGLPIILRNTFYSAGDIIQKNGVLLSKEWNEDEFISAINEVYSNYSYYSYNSINLGKRYNIELIRENWYKVLKSTEKGNKK